MNARELEIAKAARLLDEAMSGKLEWWYLSFADAALPRGSQFLGAVCVQAMGFASAVEAARARGLNPGGEVRGLNFPDAMEPPEAFRHRLLTRKDAEALDVELKAQRAARGLEP